MKIDGVTAIAALVLTVLSIMVIRIERLETKVHDLEIQLIRVEERCPCAGGK